jgi:hypothetical protein
MVKRGRGNLIQNKVHSLAVTFSREGLVDYFDHFVHLNSNRIVIFILRMNCLIFPLPCFTHGSFVPLVFLLESFFLKKFFDYFNIPY